MLPFLETSAAAIGVGDYESALKFYMRFGTDSFKHRNEIADASYHTNQRLALSSAGIDVKRLGQRMVVFIWQDHMEELHSN